MGPILQSSLILLAGVASSSLYSRYFQTHPAQADDRERFSCRPFLPRVFVETPPPVDHPLVRDAVRHVDEYLAARFKVGDIDSLSVAIVTSKEPLYEKNFGVMRGNESATSPPTNSHSSYRIASVSKLLTVLEGHILAQRGVLSWDDPVTKLFPDLSYRLDGFHPDSKKLPQNEAPVTLFDLAGHMSGMGRDWPPGTVSNWPKDMQGGGPPPINGLPFPDHASLFKAIASHRLTSPPFSYPAYSNTATGLLGLALVVANRLASEDPSHEPDSYAALLKRDIFDPMGLNGSHFLTTEQNRHLVVVPSLGPEVADQDFFDAMNPAGGQFMSLHDTIVLLQTFLNPEHPKSLLTRYSMDKWMQPVHDFEEDDWTEIGFIWEIIKAKDSNNRLRKIYWKLGAMVGFHSAIAFHPGTSYGVSVLMGAHYPDAAKLAYDIFDIVQPFMDKALADYSQKLFAGTWKSQDGESTSHIVIEKGALYIDRFVLNGTDILQMFHAPGRLALRSSERRDELRLDTGIPGYNGEKHMGCYPYWNGQDLWGLRDEAPINLIYFTGEGNTRALHVPSVGVTMKRT
ncbi:beta-lactamase/transpeptidase-like protein [Obba rivulosa]|uniref:Beta-lactamase/transpeptidase-like protein n=1 Tax=Obba rivulosa TaxID=1052685 RepID=A0A8E2AY06_9APHY|nr:beta-lactamase/transpeptidase-like protein [Obba rivulosa]